MAELARRTTSALARIDPPLLTRIDPPKGLLNRTTVLVGLFSQTETTTNRSGGSSWRGRLSSLIREDFLMSEKRCLYCGRRYEPYARAVESQKHCGLSECRRKHKRARDRA